MGWWTYLIGKALSPVGLYLAVGSAILVALFAAYVKIGSDAVSGIVAESTKDALRRTQDAITAGDAAAIDPERLLENDGNRRE